MIFSWLIRRRRAKILVTPFPDNWDPIIRDNVRYACHLTPDQQQKLRRLVQIFGGAGSIQLVLKDLLSFMTRLPQRQIHRNTESNVFSGVASICSVSVR